MGEPGDARHDAPAQHSDGLAHELVRVRQVGPVTHTPPAHVRPALHRGPAQHTCPDAPHAGVVSGIIAMSVGGVTSRGGATSSGGATSGGGVTSGG
jgi:hypothetical protein